MRGDSESALPDGDLTILRVTRVKTVGTVRLPRDTVQDNARVRFELR